jgi:xanthine dehydrogenase accessory factor
VRELAETIERWRARGDRVALATVVATRRSAPRPVGSKLAVSQRGELYGSVSARLRRSDVAVTAAEVLAEGTPRLLTYGIADEQAGRSAFRAAARSTSSSSPSRASCRKSRP